jgi:hypothetical protein
MTAAPPPAHSRSRAWAVGALVVVVLAAAVVIVLRLYAPAPQRGGVEGAVPSPGAPPAPVEQGGTAASGCLGGESRDAAMVQAAQQSAGHDPTGAVEVSTAFVRWLNQYPYPEDAAQAQQTLLSAQAPTRDLVAFFETGPDLSGGLVAASEPYWLSTVTGVYHVESAEPDAVTASIGTALVRDGELSPTLKGSITVTVVWEDGRWAFVRSEGTRTTEDLFSIGAPFSGGC